MTNLDQIISTTVAHQFPEFYETDGPNLIAFIRAYYEFMEQQGYAVNASKNLLNYMDIDSTIDQFVLNFKNEFLVNFPSITATNQKLMAKKIKDFYTAKGSNQGMQLLFRLLFDDDITIYNPGVDILRASDGVWTIPVYLETEHNTRNISFKGNQITGSISGATAFVESVHTTVVNQRIIDVINISSVKGYFIYGESITDDGNLANAPIISGSLTDITITDGGANNSPGDLFEIVSSSTGWKGSAKVVSVTNGTGRVSFTLEDGGSGYTNSASQVFVSNTIIYDLQRSQTTINYTPFSYVCQPLNSLVYTVSSPSIPNADVLQMQAVYGYNSSNAVIASGKVVSYNPSIKTAIISVTNGSFSQVVSVGTTSNSVLFSGFTISNTSATGFVTGSNSTALGLHSEVGTFYANAAIYNYPSLANTTVVQSAVVNSIATGYGAGFTIGSLTDTESVFLFTDLLSGNNVNGEPWVNMILCGSNANTGLLLGNGSIICNSASNKIVAGGGANLLNQFITGSGVYTSTNNFIGTINNVSNSTTAYMVGNALANVVTSTYYYNIDQYGFPKNPGDGPYSPMSDFLGYGNYTIGTISSLGYINPGQNYNATPFVAVRNNFVAAYNRQNIILTLGNVAGIFAKNDLITQTYATPNEVLTYSANVGALVNGEGVTQSNGSANSYGTIQAINSTSVTVSNINGNFIASANIVGMISKATANIQGVSGVYTYNIAKGRIVNIINPTTIELKRSTFNESFQMNTAISGSSGGSAIVQAAFANTASAPMGFNAAFAANVQIGVGIANQLQVIDSGFGYQPGDNLELVNNANPYGITGIANVINQGIGSGYWKDNRGKLNSDKYIIDDTYYQDFSYEIQSKLSLDKYADILKRLAHMAGTNMFGKVIMDSSQINQFTPISSSIQYPTNFNGKIDFSVQENSGLIAVLGV